MSQEVEVIEPDHRCDLPIETKPSLKERIMSHLPKIPRCLKKDDVESMVEKSAETDMTAMDTVP